jgi:hypothetical protein
MSVEEGHQPPPPMGDYWGEDGRLSRPPKLSLSRQIEIAQLMEERQWPKAPTLREQWPRWKGALRGNGTELREGLLSQTAETEAEPADCVVCSPWAAEERAWLRESLTVIPLRAHVCEACLEAWWASLPKAPPLEGP